MSFKASPELGLARGLGNLHKSDVGKVHLFHGSNVLDQGFNRMTYAGHF